MAPASDGATYADVLLNWRAAFKTVGRIWANRVKSRQIPSSISPVFERLKSTATRPLKRCLCPTASGRSRKFGARDRS